MFRTMIAAAAALAFAAPAMAQDSDLLVGEPWECRVVSFGGGPISEVLMMLDESGEAFYALYMETPMEDTLIAFELDIAGEWLLDGATLSVQAYDVSVVNAWVNGEEMAFDDVQALGEEVAVQFANYGGQQEIAFISEHALVLEEPDTSISCWR